MAYTRELDAGLPGLDLGPTLSVDHTERLRLSASLGATLTWIDSEFSYRDGSFAQGRTTNNDWLFGAYASADLNVLIGEHRGLFGGAAYTRMENFNQQTAGRSAELQFNDSYTVRAGVFFREPCYSRLWSGWRSLPPRRGASSTSGRGSSMVSGRTTGVVIPFAQ